MASAFQCDTCGDLEEGEPNRIRVSSFEKQGMFGWVDRQTTAKAELCDECSNRFDEMARKFLGSDAQ